MLIVFLVLLCAFIVPCQNLEEKNNELNQINQRGKEAPLANEIIRDLALIVSPRDSEDARFLREQSVAFNLALHNEGTTPQTVLAISSNRSTPVLRILDADGKPIGEYTPNDMFNRMLKSRGRRRPPPKSIEIKPGLVNTTWVNLWTYMPPLPSGSYAFEIRHFTDSGSAPMTSNRLSFEIMDARVLNHAIAYESFSRMVSTLAWVAEPYDERYKPRLLLRLSNFSAHHTIQQGSTFCGEVSADTLLALSQIPPGERSSWLGWLSVVSDNKVELIQHNMTFPRWRSGPMELSLTDIQPLPRFPDRGYAVFLATGTDLDGKAALTGLVVKEGEADPSPWTLPISTNPTRSACAFDVTGPISLLLVSEEENSEGKTITLITRLDVDESGQIATPERIIRTTENKALAVAVDMRPNAPQAFIVLEAHPQKYDHLALIRIPVDGKPEIPELASLEGWPAMTRAGKDYEWPPGQGTVDRASEVRIPLAATQVSLEIDLNGTPWMAMVDEQGDFYATRLDGQPLTFLRENGEFQSESLHIAALSRGLTISCFSQRGALVHLGGL